MNRLPPFPVDPETLDLIQLAIDTDGISAASTLELIGHSVDADGAARSYAWTDAITALIAEVRRLRTRVPEGEPHA